MRKSHSRNILLLCGSASLVVSAEALDSPVPLPDDLVAVLVERMCYVHVHHLRGVDAFDHDGKYMPVQPEQRKLHRIDEYGRIICGIGFLDFVATSAEGLGYSVTVRYTDGWFNHPREGRFEPSWESVDLSELRYRQKEILDLVLEYDRACVSAPPGYGKSHTFAAICKLLPKARIKIIVDGAGLLEQLYHRLRGAGLPHVGIVYGKEKRFDRITCVSADCLKHLDPTDRVGNRGGDAYLIDEVHKMMTDGYLEVLRQLQYAKVIGFSATLDGRTDGADAKLESICGPKAFTMSYQEAQEHGVVSPVFVEWLRMLKTEESPAFGKVTQASKYRNGIWLHKKRNELLANRMRQFGPETQVLCLVATIKHAMELKKLLPDYTLVYGESMEMDRYQEYVDKGIINPMSEPVLTARLRRALREKFERRELMKVIATDVWREGVDFAELEVVVRADARSGKVVDYQGPGRVTRLHKDKTYGLVIDVHDDWDDYFLRMSKSRRRNYERRGWLSNYDQLAPGKRNTR